MNIPGTKLMSSTPSTAESLPLPVSPTDIQSISAKSLWKVFGKNPEMALTPQYASQDRATILETVGCVVALQNVSFSVTQGETFVVMGLSGSGKSTLVRCLIRLIEPTSGEIFIQGQNVSQLNPAELVELRRSKVAMVFQHYGLLPHRRVLDNAAWGLEVQGVNKATRYARTQEVLDLVGLTGWENAYPQELSGGMQQRVGLARALAVNPDILLMDEPFSGLDPLIRRNMQDELVRLQKDLHKTIVFITHDLAEALKIGDRIAIMRDGRIVQIGSPEEIVLSPNDEYVKQFTQDVRWESILTASRLMARPRAVLSADQGAEAAVRVLEAHDCTCVLVVDRQAKYLGVLSPEDLKRATRDKVQDFEQSREYLQTEVLPVQPNTCCEELIPLSLTNDQPIPVVDDQGTLIGVIHRDAVADAISKTLAEKAPGPGPAETNTDPTA